MLYKLCSSRAFVLHNSKLLLIFIILNAGQFFFLPCKFTGKSCLSFTEMSDFFKKKKTLEIHWLILGRYSSCPSLNVRGHVNPIGIWGCCEATLL